jgi:hypothetical protein
MDVEMLGRVWQASLATFLERELMQGRNLLLLDLNKIVPADECVKACIQTHNDGATRLIRAASPISWCPQAAARAWIPL